MGEIADDCYDRALDEMEARNGDPDWDGHHSPRLYYRAAMAVKPPAPKTVDFYFTAIDKALPHRTHSYLVKAVDLSTALRDFFTNEWHEPYRALQLVPKQTDLTAQDNGGWIVFGQTQTVLIHHQ